MVSIRVPAFWGKSDPQSENYSPLKFINPGCNRHGTISLQLQQLSSPLRPSGVECAICAHPGFTLMICIWPARCVDFGLLIRIQRIGDKLYTMHWTQLQFLCVCSLCQMLSTL